ncbi:MAG: hypothetical protein ACOYI5_04985 [Christensenellales bacterium]
MQVDLAFLLTVVPEGRVFGLDQQTFISVAIQLFNACVLAIALSLLLYKPVQSYMRKRAERIRAQFDTAQARITEGEQLKEEYEKKLRAIDTERLHILEDARAAAAERTKHVLDEARHEAAVIKQRAEDGAQAERERLKEDARRHIIEVSAAMAGKFVEASIDGAAQDRLFDETMRELEEATWLS